uniref:CUB domain-containing protein n=1 Tax=Heterorhabditis bacteriophora TaxID=37862 RepID=A0A1I7XSN1_HETBA
MELFDRNNLRAPDVHLNPNTSTITCSWSIYTSSDIVNKSINSRNTMEEHCYSNSLLKKERDSIGTRCSHTTTTGFGPVYSNSRPLVRCIFSDLRLNSILHHYQIDMTTANIRLPTRIGANALDGSASVKCAPETSITTACACPISSIILSTLIVRDNLRQQ